MLLRAEAKEADSEGRTSGGEECEEFGFEVDGAGGRGADWDSPMRRRVRVSWALVGTSLRSVLCSVVFIISLCG